MLRNYNQRRYATKPYQIHSGYSLLKLITHFHRICLTYGTMICSVVLVISNRCLFFFLLRHKWVCSTFGLLIDLGSEIFMSASQKHRVDCPTKPNYFRTSLLDTSVCPVSFDSSLGLRNIHWIRVICFFCYIYAHVCLCFNYLLRQSHLHRCCGFPLLFHRY